MARVIFQARIIGYGNMPGLGFYLFICIAPFHNKIVSRCFTESETQNQNPQVSTVARKNSLLTGRNLEQDPAYKEEPSC